MLPVFGADNGRVVDFVAVGVPIPRRSGGFNCRGARGMLPSRTRCSRKLSSLALPRPSSSIIKCWKQKGAKSGGMRKTEAEIAANDVLSALMHYSKFAGRPVCGRRYLSDWSMPDMPIVYCSDAFLRLTGYSIHEILRRNCRLLNGSDTYVDVLHQIRDNIQAEQACTVHILNYRMHLARSNITLS